MKPIDFVLFDGDSSPNTPVHEVSTALQKDLAIYTPGGEELEVLSYYFDESKKQLVLELDFVISVRPVSKR